MKTNIINMVKSEDIDVSFALSELKNAKNQLSMLEKDVREWKDTEGALRRIIAEKLCNIRPGQVLVNLHGTKRLVKNISYYHDLHLDKPYIQIMCTYLTKKGKPDKRRVSHGQSEIDFIRWYIECFPRNGEHTMRGWKVYNG